jgi:DNA-binding MarR family transcriptional regulator
MFERCLYFNANSLTRKLNSIWEKAFAEFDLPPSHAYLLRLVLEHPGLTQQKLAEELRLNKSTVTRFIASLEKKGLVLREGTSSDQRQRIVVPSAKALVIQSELAGKGSDLYASMCEKLGRENVEEFVKTARLLHEKL